MEAAHEDTLAWECSTCCLELYIGSLDLQRTGTNRMGYRVSCKQGMLGIGAGGCFCHGAGQGPD